MALPKTWLGELKEALKPLFGRSDQRWRRACRRAGKLPPSVQTVLLQRLMYCRAKGIAPRLPLLFVDRWLFEALVEEAGDIQTAIEVARECNEALFYGCTLRRANATLIEAIATYLQSHPEASPALRPLADPKEVAEAAVCRPTKTPPPIPAEMPVVN